jgi:hypothetical protein
MARKRIDFGADVDGQIRALTAKGGTAKSIAATLSAAGVKGSSSATIGRRMRELRGTIGAPSPRSKAPTPAPPPDSAAAPLPSKPEEIPADATPTQLDRWITQADDAVNAAEAAENLPLMGQMLRVAASLAETRRKATPPEPPDPNANPDMIAAAKRARAALHKLIDSAVG